MTAEMKDTMLYIVICDGFHYSVGPFMDPRDADDSARYLENETRQSKRENRYGFKNRHQKKCSFKVVPLLAKVQNVTTGNVPPKKETGGGYL